MLNERSALAFVSTSSICQGEQVGILWPAILEKANIAFAHQAFKWTNNARNVAAVHCVIIGLEKNPKRKTLFSGNIKQDVSNISPYLLNSSNYIVHKETKPINGLPVMGIGNKPIDDGNYLFLKDEMLRFIRNEPLSQPFFHEWYGADELLNLKKRWCLLVKDIPDDLLDKMPTVRERVDLVKKFRLKSKSKPTQKLAEKPRNFHVENFPKSDFIVIPKVSSENKKYIPVAILNINQIASDLLNVIDSNSLYVFGLISSEMHMLWVSTVGGRFGNGYRYSSGLCYNTFPLPDSNPKKQKIIEELAANLLLIRERYPDKSLGQLYAPETMPIELLQAHKELDSAIENLYRDRPFVNSSDRLEHLFKMYGNNKLKTNSEKIENLTTGELW